MGFSLTSVKNARELGGYAAADGRHIKKGILLRTAKLSGISDEETALLRNTYKVSDIIDFRMPMEIAGFEDPVISGAEYHNIDVMQLTDSEFAAFADIQSDLNDIRAIIDIMARYDLFGTALYKKYLDCESGKRGFGDFFRIILAAAPDRAVLWHCTSGKDRTGLAAMLLMTALGVDEETVVSDYMLTNAYNSASIDKMKRYFSSLGWDEALTEMGLGVFESVEERFLRESIAHLNEKYGSVLDYIHNGLGITEKQIEELKERCLI